MTGPPIFFQRAIAKQQPISLTWLTGDAIEETVGEMDFFGWRLFELDYLDVVQATFESRYKHIPDSLGWVSLTSLIGWCGSIVALIYAVSQKAPLWLMVSCLVGAMSLFVYLIAVKRAKRLVGETDPPSLQISA